MERAGRITYIWFAPIPWRFIWCFYSLD